MIKSLLEKAKKSEIFRAVLALFGANMFASIVGIIGSLVQGRFVTAEELGFYKQFSIVTGYVFFLHLGVFNAIQRLYPLYKGKGDDKNAQKVVEIGNAWMLIVCIPITIVFIVLSIFAFVYGDWKSGLCWIAQIVAIWASLYGGFLSATYKSGKEFQKMAKASILNPMFSLLFMPLYWFQPFVTMVLRNCTSVISTIRLHITRPVRVKLRFSFKEWMELIKQGLPLFTSTYINSNGLDAIRGTLILVFLTQRDLGYWAFAYMLIMLLLQLPTSIIGVYAPHVISEYAKTGKLKEAFVITKKSIAIGLIVMTAIIPCGVVAVKLLLPIILPNYIGAKNTIYILLISVPFKLSDALNTILTAVKKVAAMNVISIIATVLQIIVSLLGSYIGLGIESFAWGFFVGYLSRTIMLLYYTKRIVRKDNDEVII